MRWIAQILGYILSSRYRLHIKGLDVFDKHTGYLILPSHVALVDPILLYCVLSQKISSRPVMTRLFYDTRLQPLFKMVGAIPVDDLEKDQGSLDSTHVLFKQLELALSRGENVLLYPQGALSRQGYQSIIGKKTAFYACQHMPVSSKIILVSMRGLWGSRSSMAWTGKSPSFLWFFLKGLFFLIINLFFFVPKRDVEIEFVDVSKDLRKSQKQGLHYFNSRLEQHYNRQGEEMPTYISVFWAWNTCLGHALPSKIDGSIESLRKQVDYSTLQYPDEIYLFVKEKIQTIRPDFHGDISLSTNLVLDLFFDSLDMAEIKNTIKSQYPKSSNPPLLDLKVVGDLVAMAMGVSPSEESFLPCDWSFSREKALLYPILKNSITDTSTILSLLKTNFKKIANQSICFDQTFGVQSSSDFLVKAYLIADILKRFPSKHIAIMLPSLSATSLLIVACYLANKVPVMLNWTQSEDAFAHCIKSQHISVILTAKSFYQKIQTPWLHDYPMTFFEELIKEVSLIQKIKALCLSKLFIVPNTLDTTAVVLFTSGSESLPKAVALSHKNIISNISGALGLLDIATDDILLAFLPPFHSFGFTVNTILPLIAGLRVVYFPDPNDSLQIASLIHHTKSSVVTATPTFLKGFFSLAHKDQLSSLRLAVVGAEKAPTELFALVAEKSPKMKLVEGYGITECSPIIAVNPYSSQYHYQKKGSVGLPIIGADIKILDIDTGKESAIGSEGMIYVAGDFVFDGYLDKHLESPFHEINHKRYYKTGDIGFMDEHGYLTISGRLKRFVKVAGEMLSIPAIESVLLEKYGSKEEISLALEAKEYPDGSVKFVIFSINSLDLSAVNLYLRKQGISNLVQIKDIVLLDAIPLLGSGKTDFMRLRNMIV